MKKVPTPRYAKPTVEATLKDVRTRVVLDEARQSQLSDQKKSNPMIHYSKGGVAHGLKNTKHFADAEHSLQSIAQNEKERNRPLSYNKQIQLIQPGSKGQLLLPQHSEQIMDEQVVVTTPGADQNATKDQIDREYDTTYLDQETPEGRAEAYVLSSHSSKSGVVNVVS